MAKIRERFVYDEHGRPAGVRLDFVDCEDLLEQLEGEQCTRVFDEACTAPGGVIRFEDVVAEIERRQS